MGKLLTIEWREEEVVSYVDRVKQRLGRPKRFLEWCAYKMHASIEKNFDVGGRPERWAPLSELSLHLRGIAGTLNRPQPILQATGLLRASIGSLKQVTARRLEYGTIDPRAGILQVGGPIRVFGKGMGTVPSRPFVVVQGEDADEILGELDRHMFLEKTLVIGA